MAFSVCESLDWDTGFFGLRIARVTAKQIARGEMHEILEWCASERIHCLYFLALPGDANTARLAQESGFQLVDVRMVYERNTTSNPEQPKHIRPFEAADLTALIQIARANHFDSRFHYDVNFPPGSGERLFTKWIENSCSGYAQTVLVADCDSKPAGYVTCHWSGGEGHIGLLGVAGWARGRGLGFELVMSALDVFHRAGIAAVTVTTQARNVASQRLYGRCGFLLRDVGLWYHRWFPENAGSNY